MSIPGKIKGLALTTVTMMAFAAGGAYGADVSVKGVACNPPPDRCAVDNPRCEKVIGNLGNVTEPSTQRKFYLDYACGLKPGDKAIFILNVHGIGGNANWQRHYFPAVDFKDKYKLIIATGKSEGTNFQAGPDDQYVLGMIDYVAKAFPTLDIKFWVAGHSAGGGYSRSFLCKDSALRSKMVGSVSLAGGRLGGAGGGPPAGFAEGLARAGVTTGAPATPGRGGTPGAGRGGGRGAPPGAGAAANPGAGAGGECGQFSHIYSTGDIDSLGGNPVPATSSHAQSLGCGPRMRRPDIVDTFGGHVYDGRDRPAPLPGWGGVPRPGTTEFYEFPNCRDGRVVADLIRLTKGHTEGLEPKVAEQIIQLMTRASKM